jgi:hypothetical protein
VLAGAFFIGSATTSGVNAYSRVGGWGPEG